jgi:hypothetical protein
MVYLHAHVCAGVVSTGAVARISASPVVKLNTELAYNVFVIDTATCGCQRLPGLAIELPSLACPGLAIVSFPTRVFGRALEHSVAPPTTVAHMKDANAASDLPLSAFEYAHFLAGCV